MNSSSSEVLDAAAGTAKGKLLHIEILVVMTAVALLLMSVLESFRRRSRSSFLKLVLLVLDTVSTSTVAYSTGLIQNVSFRDELLQVWVVLLITLKESVDYISACGTEQAQDRRRRELRDLMESCWVALLNATKGTKFRGPLWILWALNISKILHRMVSFEHASRSYACGKNPTLTSNYMRYEHELTEPDDVDPARMRGYKYLVLGEDKQKIEPMIPGYGMRLSITRENKFITIDKIWQCDGGLLSSSGRDGDGRLKDICLSFAMYKLLRRRFDDLHPLQESDHPKNRELVLHLLSEEDGYERPFRVLEVELAFLTDHFYSRYPIIFSKGFPTFSVVRVVMVAAAAWLAVLVLVNFEVREGDLEQYSVHGVGVEKLITLLLLSVLMLKEVWEVVTYIFSDWAKVVLICNYVEKPLWRRFELIERLLGFMCRSRITSPWHGKMGQYSLLSSFDYKPWNVGHRLTWGLVEPQKQGAKMQDPIKLPHSVKKAVVDSLRTTFRSSSQRLTRGVSSLERHELIRELSWTLRLETNTDTILVWHIATSLCETEMCHKYAANKERKLRSVATRIKNWWRPLPFLLSLESLEGDLRHRYEVAACLSRYCAYLVVLNQDMLSDPPAVRFIFDDTVLEARKFFKGCDTTESRYLKLMRVDEPLETVLGKGAQLGKLLIKSINSEETRWKVLSEFWSELLLCISPSVRSCCHESALAKGGEFMTHLWALLSHAGILEQTEASDAV